MAFLILAVVFLLLAIFVPLVFIWAVSTLFGITIAYTFTNWFAALVLLSIWQAGTTKV